MCLLLFSCIRKNIICELPEIKFRDQRQATSIFSEQLPHVNISSKQRWRHLASQFNGRRKGPIFRAEDQTFSWDKSYNANTIYCKIYRKKSVTISKK